jgi:glycosyltransferase involved in cell wall biosynthesis
MDLSIIIPTYNEAESLPRLLKAIQKQSGVDYEVIVADAFSDDGTREMARDFGARVVDGGMPAVGRNAGAAVASADYLLFLDADVVIKRGFLKNTLAEFKERDLVTATCRVRPMSRLTVDRALHNFMNLYIRLSQYTDPNAPGYCIFTRKDVFDRIDGFDESLKVAEDHDYVSRSAEHGSFRVLASAWIFVDVRRFEKEGRIGYALKNVRVAVYRALQGEIDQSNDFVEYEFGDFAEDDVQGGRRALRKLEKAIIKLDEVTTDIDERMVDGLSSDADRPLSDRLSQVRTYLSEGWNALTGGSDPE